MKKGAAGWYDQGMFACGFGSWVIEKHGDIPRPMRAEDHARIGELADEMSSAR